MSDAKQVKGAPSLTEVEQLRRWLAARDEELMEAAHRYADEVLPLQRRCVDLTQKNERLLALVARQRELLQEFYEDAEEVATYSYARIDCACWKTKHKQPLCDRCWKRADPDEFARIERVRALAAPAEAPPTP